MSTPSATEIEEIKEQIKLAQAIAVNSLKNIAERGEIFIWAAKAYRQLYLKLLDEGFSSDQALSIVQRYNPITK